MKLILTKAEAIYLEYILRCGFGIGEDLPKKQFDKELKLVEDIYGKLHKELKKELSK